ncbi:MAG: TatD family hydrolase [Christensenellaceae bacterium]|nr:TatD family hydrolase [Christensenellaceae bacterium]
MDRIDSHAHLNNKRFDADRGELIASLCDNGVKAVLECATEPGDLQSVVDLAEANERIFAAVGVHPHDASAYTREVEETIRDLAGREKVVAIGEIGLDYHYDFSPRDVQKQVLRAQLALAKELDMPVSLHSRESTADMLEILAEFAPLKGVMHCFSGSVETMRIVLGMGLHIGFGGSLTFKGNVKTVAAAEEVPLDRILLETDSPYLAPVPMRGRRNDPTMTCYVAEKLAEIKGISAEEIAAIAMENTLKLFPKMALLFFWKKEK